MKQAPDGGSSMKLMDSLQAVCRKATKDDVDVLFDLIQGYAEKGIMLPRTRYMLEYSINSFIVAEVGDQVVGCGSLTKLGDNLIEIRSLGMSDGYKGLGIGSKLVDGLLAAAREQGITKVMALTYEVAFFLRNGFTVVDKEIFPEKVWTDCVNCPKQNACDEIAVLKVLE
ncbi:GNAT family N-acetyltransferase [Paenibacillus sp. BIHB 4019]|uniref:GNAT family N-acetyltransferase n=2 Tax=Paenibacillus sp. BIHB 4019 TaxID=1870819 RepID=A0A1B2DT28_9BACL|nr:GNAT family N-acetyltransferase [Paenibacillus sp. BIHB 4019]